MALYFFSNFLEISEIETHWKPKKINSFVQFIKKKLTDFNVNYIESSNFQTEQIINVFQKKKE